MSQGTLSSSLHRWLQPSLASAASFRHCFLHLPFMATPSKLSWSPFDLIVNICASIHVNSDVAYLLLGKEKHNQFLVKETHLWFIQYNPSWVQYLTHASLSCVFLLLWLPCFSFKTTSRDCYYETLLFHIRKLKFLFISTSLCFHSRKLNFVIWLLTFVSWFSFDFAISSYSWTSQSRVLFPLFQEPYYRV